MRYQERIYIQNNNDAVRNKDILNFNMSSDMCIFEAPQFSISGASKIDCTGTTGTSYVVTTATTIPLTFIFTGNTDTFTANSATFKYEVYKFDTNLTMFSIPPVYASNILEYSGFSGSNTTTQNIPISNLTMDGEYLIKGYYEYSNCTEFLNKIGKKTDTLKYSSGSEYGLYNSKLDYYFIAIKSADEPLLLTNNSNSPQINSLFQQIILPTTIDVTGSTVVLLVEPNGSPILTLNGLVLAPTLDYNIDGLIITLYGELFLDDTLTMIYTTGLGTNLASDNIYITSNIISGSTNNQGSETSYYNTTTNKYEIYTSVTPLDGNTILVMINGATLANGIDYYQSISNPKRIILEGDLSIYDIITIVYFPRTDVVNGLITNQPIISWSVANVPQLVNGFFTLEVSSASTFTNYIYTGITDYVVGQSVYTDNFTASGIIGTNLYYRVKNEKNYITFCGNIVNTTKYSEVIPLTIQTNAINSY
jgi:hypothetical protein